MRTFCILVLILATAGAAQAQRAGRQRDKKPGEVITRADMSQGFYPDHLQIDGPAPGYTLPRLARGGEKPGKVSLKELRAKKPAVLIFGSMTCPPFRRHDR